MSQLIEQVLIEQNPHWNGISYHHTLMRTHDKEALADLTLPEIQIVTGIRRCGKSTLLQTLINHLMSQVEAKSLLYINFDDPNYLEMCNNPSSLYSIVTTAEKLTASSVSYLFLDEVQNLQSWEKYVKSVYDIKRFRKIIVTGSNAELLAGNYATLLSGRYIETRIYPLTFREFLLNNAISNRFELVKQKAKTLALLDSMLNFGSFPRIHDLPDPAVKRKLLKSYYETLLLKDCISNHAVRDTKAFINLAHYLISQAANLYSYNSLSKIIGSNETTIQNFIQILENAYFIEELKNFSYSLKTQTKAKKKIYCIDNGLITATTFKFSNNYGKLLENLIYTELRKQHKKIYFSHDAIECDFIVHEENPLAIQSCYEFTADNRERELKGLLNAMEKFSIPQGLIITYDYEENFSDRIKILPFWKWAAFPDDIPLPGLI
ncbi:ATP-binding protein [soil metagenome]